MAGTQDEMLNWLLSLLFAADQGGATDPDG
jgi:hypothetical protein